MPRRLIGIAARLYPRRWRDRYEAELAALVEEMPAAGWAVLWDLAKGALAMQLRYRGRAIARAAAAMSVIGLAAALAGSLAIRDVYASEAVLTAGDGNPDRFYRAVQTALSRDRVAAVMARHGLYPDAPREAGIETMRRNTRVSAPADGGHRFRVGFLDVDPAVSQRVAQELAGEITKLHGGVLVLDEAPLPRGPVYPNRAVVGLLGMLGGALVGAFWAMVRA